MKQTTIKSIFCYFLSIVVIFPSLSMASKDINPLTNEEIKELSNITGLKEENLISDPILANLVNEFLQNSKETKEEAKLAEKHKDIIENYEIAGALLQVENSDGEKSFCRIPQQKLRESSPSFMKVSQQKSDPSSGNNSVRECNEQELTQIPEDIQLASLGSYGGRKEAGWPAALGMAVSACALGAVSHDYNRTEPPTPEQTLAKAVGAPIIGALGGGSLFLLQNWALLKAALATGLTAVFFSGMFSSPRTAAVLAPIFGIITLGKELGAERIGYTFKGAGVIGLFTAMTVTPFIVCGDITYLYSKSNTSEPSLPSTQKEKISTIANNLLESIKGINSDEEEELQLNSLTNAKTIEENTILAVKDSKNGKTGK